MTMNRRRLLIPTLLLFALAACEDAKNPVVPGAVSFRSDVQPIFSARCAVSGCHAQPSPQAGCDLSAGQSYANLVNVQAVVFAPGVRIKPDDPEGSVLYQLISAGTMPAKGNPLRDFQIETIRTWIEQGAKDD